jgi:hypothetical protein
MGSLPLQRRARFSPAIAVVFHKLCCTTRTPKNSSATVPVADCTQAFTKTAPLRQQKSCRNLQAGSGGINAQAQAGRATGATNSPKTQPGVAWSALFAFPTPRTGGLRINQAKGAQPLPPWVGTHLTPSPLS